ncbi:nuclear transport factor 2 family protein [Erythrobacter mangrovi]|uniref:Nuclear transport factor 2 family protein n=1 Tax=Erythrobacter mangrovi TaxID=2739433 RepID=A0A7D4AUY0_9SPHN|nr:nuclear transport factor 2 family protein [Erythrobacter mangrovi]QKG72317.1 nuclear transport factor 2 family protein [Erythrobacter mangrovi]
MSAQSKVAVFVFAMPLLIGFASSGIAQESRWGSPDEDDVKYMIAAAAKWSDAQCSPQEGLQDIIADDFQGTFTSGQRFGKDQAITTDPIKASLSRECQLGDVRVRFFGDSYAIAYGAENRIRKDVEGNEALRCQIWTDTWLKRDGRWQIIASHDTVVTCPQ